MKHSFYKITRPIARFLLAALPLTGGIGGGLTSCDHPVSILDIESESELVIYAFPTTDDEFLVNVSLTRPTAGNVGTLQGVTVECTTNPSSGSGQPHADEVTFVHAEKHFGIPMAIYRVKGEHHSGDKISIRVKADAPSGEGKSLTATAETTIPADMPIEVTTVDTISPKLRFLVRVPALAVSLQTGGKEGRGYYATRLTSVKDSKTTVEWESAYDDGPDEVYHTWMWTNFAPIDYSHLSIEPSLEPLLNHYTDLDLDPWNEYYEKMYFFSSDDVRASSAVSSSASATGGKEGGVVLHLQTEYPSQMDFIDVQFYTLSPEYYLMLRHINDQLSNDLGNIGLTQTYSTYSNVRGGFGCVAAYACSHYRYTPPVYDGLYYGNMSQK